jgi:hypothetical protein
MVRKLPEVKPGICGTDTPLQGASVSGLPAGGEELGHLVSGVDGICLAKKALSGCARQKLKKVKARASETRTGGIQQPGNASAPKQGETSTGTPKRLRSKGSTPTETARPPKRPRDSSGPGNYKEAPTNTRKLVLKIS